MTCVSCMVLVTLATISPKAEKVADPMVTSRKTPIEIAPRGHVEGHAADQNLDQQWRERPRQ